MSDIPKDLKYVDSHEWLEELDSGNWRIGITDHAQAQLGELVFVELPEVGSEIHAGDACGVVESVKAASDIYAPVSGEVVTVNENLEDEPDHINNDCYGDGWLFEITASSDDEISKLLDAEAYTELVDD